MMVRFFDFVLLFYQLSVQKLLALVVSQHGMAMAPIVLSMP